MFPDKYAKYLDLPQNFSKGGMGSEYYIAELRTLAADMERLSGNRITDDALGESIRLYNRNRELDGH